MRLSHRRCIPIRLSPSPLPLFSPQTDNCAHRSRQHPRAPHRRHPDRDADCAECDAGGGGAAIAKHEVSFVFTYQRLDDDVETSSTLSSSSSSVTLAPTQPPSSASVSPLPHIFVFLLRIPPLPSTALHSFLHFLFPSLLLKHTSPPPAPPSRTHANPFFSHRQS